MGVTPYFVSLRLQVEPNLYCPDLVGLRFPTSGTFQQLVLDGHLNRSLRDVSACGAFPDGMTVLTIPPDPYPPFNDQLSCDPTPSFTQLECGMNDRVDITRITFPTQLTTLTLIRLDHPNH